MTVAALSLAACEAPLGPADPPTEFLRGDWTACLNDGAQDYSKRMAFYSDSFSTLTHTYATTDGTCGGAETSTSNEIWRYRLGRAAPALLGAAGTEVPAREMNVENSFVTLFTIVYVDEQATPPRLYLGDLAFDPAQDGSAPDKRPRLLAASTALTGE